MQIQPKQMTSDSGEDFRAFMEASFPTLKRISIDEKNLGYKTEEEDGESVIRIGRGESIDPSLFPQEAKATWSNTKTGAETVDLDWEDSVLAIDTKIGGNHKVYGKILNLGIYNPKNIVASYTISIDRAYVSLTNWYKNGANIEEVSYQNATTAQELEVLSGIYVTSMDGAFDGMENLISLPEQLYVKPDVDVTSLAATYRNCKKLKNIPDIDTSKCTIFTSAFQNAESLTDLSAVNMLKANDASYAFAGCKALEKVPTDMGVCKNLSHAFEGAENLIDLSDLNVSQVTNFSNAFSGCIKLQKVPVNMKAGTNFSSAFKGNEALVDLSEANMSSATDINNAFNGCKNIAALPDIFTSGKITNYASAFSGCTSLPEEFPYIINMNNITATTCLNMFKDSSVKTVKVRYTKEEYPGYITPARLGVETVIILDANGNERDPFTETVKHLSSGTYDYYVPAGVSKLKVALVSSASYSFTYSGGAWHATNRRTLIQDANGNTLSASLESPQSTGSGICVGGDHSKHGGIPAMFDAVWEDGSALPWYSCGAVGYAKGYNNQAMWGWVSLGNTFNQEVIDVTPGQKLTITIPTGGYGEYSQAAWSDGQHYTNGYALIQPQKE